MLISGTCSTGLETVMVALTWSEGAEGRQGLAERSTRALLITVLLLFFIAVHLHFFFSLLAAGFAAL